MYNYARAKNIKNQTRIEKVKSDYFLSTHTSLQYIIHPLKSEETSKIINYNLLNSVQLFV